MTKELLGAAAESRGVVTGIDGKQINGKWKFKDQTVKLSVGTSSQEIYFEPESTDYNEVTAFVNVTVVKAIPYISEQPTATYTHGDCLYNQQPVGGKAIWEDGKGGEPGESGTTTNVPNLHLEVDLRPAHTRETMVRNSSIFSHRGIRPLMRQ